MNDTPALNRVIRIATRTGLARASLEDDFHHFRIEVVHDGSRVTAVNSQSLRNPFTLCPAAGARLTELIGQSLTVRIRDIFAATDARQQCTHQLDLAAFAIAAAARGTGIRRYDARVADDDSQPCRLATVSRGGVEVLAWNFADGKIIAPEPFTGVSLGRGFSSWVSGNLDDETTEAALVLRRSIFISSGRGKIALLDAMEHAAPHGGCWVGQPERAAQALRERGSTSDFTGRAQLLTSKDDAWISFDDLTQN
ncbi:hypothetical protein [Parasphingorhabdus sp.]|uniref:hypothetical protein n=1 Tax=Parasphingorhabdus sp. TaxID=2709688 RepID=UPI003001D166